MVECQICHKIVKQITEMGHLRLHNITFKKYKKLFPNSENIDNRIIFESYQKWLDNGQPKIFCKCGCNREIIIKEYCIYCGIPEYLYGHNPRKQKISIEIDKFIEEHTNKHLCNCGCNQFIKILRSHYRDGIPNRIDGHQNVGLKRSNNARSNISNGHKNIPCKESTRDKLSKIRKGKWSKEKNPGWRGGVWDQPYCERWTERLRETIRNEYNRKCYICGKDEKDNLTKTNKVRKLSVHHIDMDKGQGCDGKKWKLVPLCMKCHSKLHHGKGVIING